MDVTHTGSSMKWRTALMVLHSSKKKKKKNASTVNIAVIANIEYFVMEPIFRNKMRSSIPVH